MKIKYNTIKKIHLYACLSTVAVLLMFIITSYVMIHHDRFDHDSSSTTEILNYDPSITTDQDRQDWSEEHDVHGRLIKSYSDKAGHPVLEYQNAGARTRLTFLSASGQVEVARTTKSQADAFVGVHRNYGYGGGIIYNSYAFLLDVLGVSLVLFTITGIYMWMKLLKKNQWTWIILLSGFAYFISVLFYLTFG